MATPAETRATTIFNALDAPFTLPPVTLTGADYLLPSQVNNPFYAAIEKIEIGTLTEGTVGGEGAFEKLMAAMKAHLSEEFDKGRITGNEYTKVYIEGMTLAMGTGLQFVMGKELAYWQAMLAREQGKRAEVEVVMARVQLEVTKAQLALARYQAEIAQAQFTLTKMQLASEDAKYELTWRQHDLVLAQISLTEAQDEVAWSQTSDTRRGGFVMQGTIKRQRELLEQQRASFQRADEAKIGKMYLDTWIVQRTTDENLGPPTSLADTQINAVLNGMRTAAGL